MKKKTVIAAMIGIALSAFFTWRFVRPMNIFVVSEKFERPIQIHEVPPPLKSLSAKECAVCHRDIYEEWKTTIHSQAWTDPYFQVDFRYDRGQQICKNCHIPLENQQEDLVLGFRDGDKFDPILKPNPNFDAKLQHEGITCAVCHVKNGHIVGPRGRSGSPHPVKKMADSNQVCAKCHVVQGDRWDTFYYIPPCGTVAEIEGSVVKGTLNCVECHMPSVDRAIVVGGEVRKTRRHWWRGGHDPEMVKSALTANLKRETQETLGRKRYTLTLENTGTSHFFPTGTPDRHLTVDLRVVNQQGKVVKKESYILKRTIMWRPFIVDLWDSRLERGKPQSYSINFSKGKSDSGLVEATVRYHLLDEERRKQIGYDNKEPIAYEIFRERISF